MATILVLEDDKDLNKSLCTFLAMKNHETDGFTNAEAALEGMENPGWDYFQKVYERCHGLPWTILETERCLVREICLGDLDRLYEIYAEPSVTRYMEGLFEDREKEADHG